MIETFTFATFIVFTSSLSFAGFLICFLIRTDRSWMVRWLTLIGLASVLLIRPMADVFTVFVVWGVTTELGVMLVGLRNLRKADSARQFKFSVIDLLALTAISAVLVSVVARHKDALAWQAVVIGTTSGAWTTSALWASSGPNRYGSKYFLGLIGTGLCAGVCTLTIANWPETDAWSRFMGAGSFSISTRFAIWCAFFFTSFLLVCLVVRLGVLVGWLRPTLRGQVGREPKIGSRLLSAIAIVALFVLVGIMPGYLLVRLSMPVPLRQEHPENVSNFQLIEASIDNFAPLVVTSVTNELAATPINVPAIRFLVDSSEPAYQRLSELLTLPATPSVTDTQFNVMSHRNLARMLSAKAKVQASHMAVVDVCKEGMELATKLRGGLFLHSLVGSAIEGILHSDLHGVIPRLNANQCRELIAYFKVYAESREPFSKIVARDRMYSENTYGWQGHLELIAEDLLAATSTNREAYSYVIVQKERLIMTCLACQLYQLENSKPPDCLEELASIVDPVFLTDPNSPSKATFRLRWKGAEPQIYGVGADGIDQNGEGDDIGFFQSESP